MTGTYPSLFIDGETEAQGACSSRKMGRPRVLTAGVPVSPELLYWGCRQVASLSLGFYSVTWDVGPPSARRVNGGNTVT